MFSGKGLGESAAGVATAGLGAAALSRIPLGPLNLVKGLLAFATIPLFNEAGMKGYNVTKQYVSQNNNLDLDIISKAGGIKNIFTPEPNTAKTADIVARPAAQVSSQSRATDTSSIGPEPEGKTQVVITDATTNQQPQVVPTATGSAAELPYVSSSNPDNFYVLYSQVHYNVVI